MSYLRTKVVDQARAWLGYSEASGKHREIIDTYNSHKPRARGYKVTYTDDWCATFVSAVAIKVGYTDIIPTECGCGKMRDLLIKLGSWEENDAYVPQPGDIMFYDWQDKKDQSVDNTGTVEHVGIVEKVVGRTITIIEGNYKNTVKRRTKSINSRYIRGYGVPKYDAIPTPKPEPKPTPKPVAKPSDDITVDGIWGIATTKKAQQVFKTTVDGKISNQYKKYAKTNPGLSSETFEWETKPTGSSKLIKAIQKKVGVEQDGHIGPDTIKAMQKWLGTTADGVVSKPSQMVKAFQKWLNKQ